jgi:hypothetical protein
MYVNVDLQTIFYSEFVGMFVIYLRTRIHMSGYSGSLVIAIKLKAKYICHTAAMLLFYILESSTLLLLLLFICIVGGGVESGSTRHVGHSLAYCTCPG